VEVWERRSLSILLQEFPYWIFLFHCRLLTSSANLRVASTFAGSQTCFNAIIWIPHLQITLLVQKGVGTSFPTTPLPMQLLLLLCAMPFINVLNKRIPCT